MGRQCVAIGSSMVVKQDLAKLDKSPDMRRSALQSLRACVEQLDQSSMPRFLAQVSADSRDSSDSSRSYAISLYEDVARVHGKLVTPHLPRIMATVVRSLSSSGSSLHLQEACSKVVASILRYSICPDSPAAEIDAIYREVCSPLLDSLLSKLEPLAAGSALCLQAVVESEKWKHAPRFLAAELLWKSIVALKERPGQTVAHMQLARSLARITGKPRPELVNAAKELLQAAPSWQHKAAALQLLRASAANLDKKDVAALELASVAEVLEELRLDRMPHVRKEAVKTSQALKLLVASDASPRKEGSASSSSQESQLVSYSPPPVSSASSSVGRRHAHSKMRASNVSGTSSSSGSELGSPSRTKSLWCTASAISADDTRSELCSLEGSEFVQAEHFNAVSRYSQVEEEDSEAVHEVPELEAEDVTEEVEDVTAATPKRLEQLNGLLTTDDFLKYTTPRRLVRSLQTYGDSPAITTCQFPDIDELTKDPKDVDDDEASMLDILSETGWSVRDNPIADDYIGTTTAAATAAAATAAAAAAEGNETSSQCVRTVPWKNRIGRVLGGCVVFAILVPVAMVLMQLVLNSTQEDDPYSSLVPT